MKATNNNPVKFFRQIVGTDIYPFEVIRKVSDVTYEVREMECDFDFPSGHGYNYRSNPNRLVIRIRKHNDGRFYAPGWKTIPFIPDERARGYRDWSF